MTKENFRRDATPFSLSSFSIYYLRSCSIVFSYLSATSFDKEAARQQSKRKWQPMKRGLPWRDDEDDENDEISSSDESSSLDTDVEVNEGSKKNSPKSSKSNPKLKTSQVKSTKRKSKGMDFDALSKHGYKGGLSVLSVPPPKEPNDGKQDWSWSTGQQSRGKESDETYLERQKTRAAVIEAEQLAHVQTQKEKKNLSYSQREKKKRDLGQSSRGKNYVEEEKRLLRDNGIYSGFDS